MPDSVKIGIDSTFNGAGVNAASSALSQLDQHLKSYGTAAQQINGLNQQYIAGQEQAAAAVGHHSASIMGMVMGLRNVFMAASTVGMSLMTVKKAYDFAEEGASVVRLGESFDSVARSYGQNSDLILASMRNASRGTIADTDLMLAANRAMLLGVSTNAEELGKITEVAIARGRAMGLSAAEAIDRVYTGIGRLSPKILDDLGIVTNATDRYSEYAKAHNISADAIDDYTKREIIKNAVIADSQKLMAENGGLVNDAASSYERLAASWANFTNTSKASTASFFQPLNDKLSTEWSQMAYYQKAKSAYLASGEAYDARGFTKLPMVSQSFVDAAKSYYASTENAQMRGRGVNRGAEYTAPAGAAAAAPPDYKNLLDAGLDIAKVTETYTEKTAALNEKLAEESTELDKLIHRYGKKSEKVAEQREKIAGLRQDVIDLNKDFDKATEQMALGMLKNKDATDEQQFTFARAAGLISQDAYEQATAMDQLSNAYLSGKINAEDYAAGVGSLKNIIGSLSEKAVNTYIDVWIRVHGEMPGGGFAGPNANAATTSSALEALRSSTGGGRWAGGPLHEGGWTLVGDLPGGGIGPHTEVVYDGYVFDAETTRKLYEAGLLDGATSRAISGDLSGGAGSTSTGARRATTRPSFSGASRTSTGTRASSTTNAPTTTTAPAAEETASIAAAVAEQAVNTASAAIAAQQSVTQNIGQQTIATTQMQQQTSLDQIRELRELQRLIKKQATKDDLYNIFKGAQQTSI